MAAAPAEQEEDELDALLRGYEQQAAADVAAVLQQQKQKRDDGGAFATAGKRQKVSAAADRRDQALSQPIGADNRGFKMLSAMGYQQGQRIGKSGTGLAEPLPVLVKQDKLGLGAVSKKAAAREQQLQRQREAEQRARAVAAAAEADRTGLRLGYQQRTAAAMAARRLEGQLRTAQRVCETLDTGAGITCCVMWSAPPTEAAAAASAVAMAAAAAVDELLEEPELGHTAEAGAAVKASREEAAEFAQMYERQSHDGQQQQQQQQPDDQEGEWEAWQALPPAEQLSAVLGRLRQHYCYCLYCGCRYDSDLDMQQHCPGPAEADHE
ncbi:hypothetical protein D9Q98_007087 [Chlorella vulgaris]|uniref:G-patch domain-containing protein n=1 Tax=Chlorella vulgaris TaxID=3077 RepID=A0A9D4TJF9_CHLVU|nr:hypothetical protein D9Q98_007087 [Chlorella vulgaris]